MEETVWCSWIISEKEQHCVTSFVLQLDDPTGALELLIEVLRNEHLKLATCLHKGFFQQGSISLKMEQCQCRSMFELVVCVK